MNDSDDVVMSLSLSLCISKGRRRRQRGKRVGTFPPFFRLETPHFNLNVQLY